MRITISEEDSQIRLPLIHIITELERDDHKTEMPFLLVTKANLKEEVVKSAETLTLDMTP